MDYVRQTLIKTHAAAIFNAAIETVEPGACVNRFLKRDNDLLIAGGHQLSLKDFTKIIVVGAGKAAAAMARAVELILGDRISGGLVITKYGHGDTLKYIELREAGHPIPDESGLLASGELLQLVEDADERTLIVCLLSGGGSALLIQPEAGITLLDKQKVSGLLMECGATIHEINTIRKKLSRIKGGGLRRAAGKAQVVSLVLSDVVGDDLQVIASGPTAEDVTTLEDCGEILKKYDLWPRLPPAVAFHFEQKIGRADTPIQISPCSERPSPLHLLVGSNGLALQSAAAKAAELGYAPLILSSTIQGEAKDVARVLTAIARESSKSGNPIMAPACILSGGETTVTLRGSGKGGRNMELALAAAMEMESDNEITLLSAGTDGTDGPTDAAGAFATPSTVPNARLRGLSPEKSLKENDSYRFFQETGELFITGPTRTNVMDIQIFLITNLA